jgi:hypothetical protein
MAFRSAMHLLWSPLFVALVLATTLWFMNQFTSLTSKRLGKQMAAVFWRGTNHYVWLFDPHLDACFGEIPQPPDFWGNAPACALGSMPMDGLPQGTKRYAVVQYHWAPDVPPLSQRCARYAEEWSKADTVSNPFGVAALDAWSAAKPERPDLSKCVWGISALSTNITWQTPNSGSGGTTGDGSTKKRSVLVNLIDALGRGTYHRLLAPSVATAAADDYTIYDFTRFHVVGCCSYGGYVKEIFQSLSTGVPTPPEADEGSCNAPAGSRQLTRRCADTLWQRYRDNGWIVADKNEAGTLGYYFGGCDTACTNASGRPLVSVLTEETRTFKASASVFHATATAKQPVFMTDLSPGAHNAWMNANDIGYDMSSYVRTVRESATTTGAALPLIVFFGDHGSHYGEAVEQSAMGRLEHKFPALFMLVPKSMLASEPALKRNLDINRQRLVSQFDLHHTLAAYASYPKRPITGDEESNMITRRDFFREEVPINRSCMDAGIEQMWCQCNSWVPCTSADSKAVQFQAKNALAIINSRVDALRRDNNVAKTCSTPLLFKSVDGARTSASPPLIEFVLTVRSSGDRTAKFKMSMACDSPDNIPQAHHGRFLPKPPTICKVATFFRLSSLSKSEDAIYKSLGASLGGDGKLCLINT